MREDHNKTLNLIVERTINFIMIKKLTYSIERSFNEKLIHSNFLIRLTILTQPFSLKLLAPVIGLLVIKRNLKVLSIPHISLNVDLIVNTMLTCLYV